MDKEHIARATKAKAGVYPLPPLEIPRVALTANAVIVTLLPGVNGTQRVVSISVVDEDMKEELEKEARRILSMPA